jgi:asparagine synthase (glutamine-hydrolysing)
MCGLYGELEFVGEGPAINSRASLDDIVGYLHHRGPDARGARELSGRGWRSRLAHTRLKIIDLSERAAQPMASANGRHWLVFNGEIYNHRALRSELTRSGSSFRSDSDTEVLLAALAAWGERAIPMLDGMFAFALLDTESGSILAARDAFGVKPLYYSEFESGIALASEVRCLVKSRVVPFEIDEVAVASYLAFGSVYGPGTIIKGVKELLPGHVLRFGPKGLHAERWYRPPKALGHKTIGKEEAAREVNSLLKGAVARQLSSDVPVGVFLSAGMDSSALVALATETHGHAISALTVAFDGPQKEFCEDLRAREFADACGVRHQVIRLDETQIAESLENVIEAMDQPSVDGANSWTVSRGVKNAGITVALSGLGGDEVFGGYSHLRSAHELGWLHSFLRFAHPLAAAGGVLAGEVAGGSIRGRKTVATLRHASRPGGRYAVRRALFLPEDSRNLVDGSIARTWGEHGLEGFLTGVLLEPSPAAQEDTLLELQNYLPYTLLRDTDVMSMAHALEVRVPFLDRGLVDFVLSLPLHLRFARGLQKPLLAAAVPSIAITSVAPKQGFTLPFVGWLRGGLREQTGSRLSALPFASKWLKTEGVLQLWNRFSTGDPRLWTRVWAVYVLDRWLQCASRWTQP